MDARDTARALGGVVSGLSAAQQWGWEVKRPPRRIEVTIPRNRGRAPQPDGVVVRRRDLPSGTVDGTVTSRAWTVVDCARDLPFDEALSVADSALRDPRVTREELIAAADLHPLRGRAGVRRVIDHATELAANPFESCIRAAALDVAGLSLDPQVQIGAIGWVDLADVHLQIVVECDSFAYHSGEEVFARDVRRYTELVRRDWIVVRFVWEDAMSGADRVRSVLRDVVALRSNQRASQAAYASKV